MKYIKTEQEVCLYFPTICVQVLIDWINSELEEDRIIVKDLEEDCYDGQVLQKLFGENLVSLPSHISLNDKLVLETCFFCNEYVVFRVFGLFGTSPLWLTFATAG